jgi:hypothetical protein
VQESRIAREPAVAPAVRERTADRDAATKPAEPLRLPLPGVGTAIKSGAKTEAQAKPAIEAKAATEISIPLPALPESLVVSLMVRAMMGLNSLMAWVDHPFFGGGIGSFDALYPLYAERYRAWFTIPFYHDQLRIMAAKPGAAHDEFLQVLFELGGVGILLVLFFLALVLYGFFRSVVVADGAMAGSGPWATPQGRRLGVVGMLVVVVGGCEALFAFPYQAAASALLTAIGLAMASQGAGAVLPRKRISLPLPLRIPLAAVFVVLAGGLVFHAARQEEGNRQFGGFLMNRQGNTEVAFHYLYDAYEADPLEYRYRVQLYPYLVSALGTNPDQSMPPAENDRIYGITVRGGQNNPMVLLARAQYLLNSGRIVEQAEEARVIFDRLLTTSTRVAEVWIMKAYFHAATNDVAAAQAAIAMARTMHPNMQQLINLGQIEGMMGIGLPAAAEGVEAATPAIAEGAAKAVAAKAVAAKAVAAKAEKKGAAAKKKSRRQRRAE